MDHLNTSIGELRRVPLEAVKQQAIQLWVASFVEDTLEFASAYFNDYIRFVTPHFFVDQNGRLVLMAFNTNEGYAGQKATLIEGIAVDKEFQGKGIMSAFMDQWIDWLESEYAYVFIQAYNWQIYKKYDFRPFNSNNLWKYSPSSDFVDRLKEDLVAGYANKPFTDLLRSPMHTNSYFQCMAISGAQLYSYQTASLVLSGDYAVNVTYTAETDLEILLRSINQTLSFLLPNDLVVKIPSLVKVESDRLETKLYKRDIKGRFNYIY